MERPEVEVLVHITAPSKGSDDARYRSLAAAYLQFEPRTRSCVLGGPDASTGSGQDVEAKPGPNSQLNIVQPSYQKLGVIESPILSFQSAGNNLDSPRVHYSEKHDASETQLSWEPPPSTVQDSMPDNNISFVGFCTPSRLLEFYTPTHDSSQANSSPTLHRRVLRPRSTIQSPAIRQQYQNITSPGTHRRSAATQGQLPSPPNRLLPPPQGLLKQNDTNDVFLDRAVHPSYELQKGDSKGIVIPLSPLTSHKRPLPEDLTSSDVIEETRIESSSPSQISLSVANGLQRPSRSESEPPIAKRQRTAADPEPGKTLPRSSSDLDPRRPCEETRRPFSYYVNKLQIISPSPATDNKHLCPEDMVTDVLRRLAQELKLEKRFRPEVQTRELRSFERGYWYVDCSSWTPELRHSTWIFLTDYLEKGIAGWGTSCSRDCDYTFFRLRCWGCVAGHMYLVIYVASRRQVLCTGMSWIGADGQHVIKMGTKPSRT
ncbi:hypothetical protein QBC35DRAFT_372965 [Podospora australis]|uniref:Uncharacterized protein n=1 Tax=Podospora australis TaxID=1536484 RepID=A0AAN7AN02_9PEZI|nr:hypothetical protein QBC35DRAFT_372965 [Podospora australis]